MFLRNYYNYMAMLHLGTINDSSFGDGYLSLKNTGGSITYVDEANAVNNTAAGLGYMLKGAKTNACFIVGSGTTPVTYDDYKLENQITSVTATMTWPGYPIYNSQTKKWSTTAHMMVSGGRNTINEIGLLAKCHSGSALIYRVVLDTPVVIPAYSVATLLIALEYQMP